MNFREEYGEYKAQETVDALLYLLRRDGFTIDDKSLTWTLVGVLFDKGLIARDEFEQVYRRLCLVTSPIAKPQGIKEIIGSKLQGIRKLKVKS